MDERIKTLKKILSRFKLPLAIIGAIIVALLLTAISISLYVKSGVASLDLSRPGYEQARKQVRTPERDRTFDAVGPIDKESLTEFRELYQAELKQISGSSRFSNENLEDTQLRLEPAAPAEAPTQ